MPLPLWQRFGLIGPPLFSVEWSGELWVLVDDIISSGLIISLEF
jgi:hypothetical protein